MSAQIIVHPRFAHRFPRVDVVRYFNQLGYCVSNTAARNLEAVRMQTNVVTLRSMADQINDSISRRG